MGAHLPDIEDVAGALRQMESTPHIDVDIVMSNRLKGNPGNVKNFVCLLIKKIIYRQRCSRKLLSFQDLHKFGQNQ